MTPTVTWRRVDLGIALGLGLLAVLVAISITTTVPLVAVFGAGAVLASQMTTGRRTMVVAVASVGCAVLAVLWVDDLDVVDWLVRTVLCALLALLGVQAALLRERRENRLE